MKIMPILSRYLICYMRYGYVREPAMSVSSHIILELVDGPEIRAGRKSAPICPN